MKKCIHLAEDVPEDAGRFDPGQTLVQSLERKGQLFVIDAQLVKDGCVQVTNGDWILHDVVTEIVGFSVRHPSLDAAAGHPR